MWTDAIVILGFAVDLFGPGGYPTLNFGGACFVQSAEQIGTNLLSCPELATQITSCQGLGKKVFLSLGGSTGTSRISDAGQAQSLAKTLWNLFGPIGEYSLDLRPFGDAVLDGFDIDNESRFSENYENLVSALLVHFSMDGSRKFYLSAAPQCIYPDVSNPISMLQKLDFVWVQFYNNSSCNIGGLGFLTFLQRWSSDLNSSNTPRIYVGALSFDEAGSGYQDHEGFASTITQVKRLGLSNFGGTSPF